MAAPPDLSIVVPLLNEATALPLLLSNLARQHLPVELLLCDGGSADGTPELVKELAAGQPFSCRLLTGERGRARQMNAGAAVARGRYLLFLHADSLFPDPQALRCALAALDARQALRGDRRVAGRFGLRFRRQSAEPSLAYYFYEAKARLDRPGCIHGDQGFIMPAEYFAEVGPFDTSLPVLEDDRLAERVRRTGEWLLLPAEIQTSARRFEMEGLAARQTLNAIMLNFAAVGWSDFFREAPAVYRQQSEAGQLRIAPFLQLIRNRFNSLPLQERLRLWYATGTYVRSNAWQLAFLIDARRGFRRGDGPADVEARALELLEPWFDRLTDHPPGRSAAALMTWIWFRAMCLATWERPAG